MFLKGYTEENFLDFWDLFVDSRPLASNTIQNYNTAKKHIKEFGLEYFSNLSTENIQKFELYLRSRGLKSSSIHSIHRRLKSVIIGSILADKLTKNPYDGFRVQRPRETDIKYLTEDELRRIETTPMPLERLDKIRDLFLFSCYTGLNFADICNLKKENLVKEADETWIRNPRQKTDVESVILLLPKAEAILNKYDILPVISNVRTNAFLKEIAILCGVNKNLTFHMARHTCGTLLLKHGVPIEVISKILGHSSIRTTQIYAKVLSLSVGEHLRRIKDKF
jgi:integrase